MYLFKRRNIVYVFKKCYIVQRLITPSRQMLQRSYTICNIMAKYYSIYWSQKKNGTKPLIHSHMIRVELNICHFMKKVMYHFFKSIYKRATGKQPSNLLKNEYCCSRRTWTQQKVALIMPPFEEGGAYCVAHVGRSVCMSVCRYVGIP